MKISISFIFLAIILLQSCIKVENSKQVILIKKCNVARFCNFELAEANIRLTTDLLGKEHVQILDKQPIVRKSTNIHWNVPNGNLADSQTLVETGLDACENDSCSNTSNPTGYHFPNSGIYTVSASGTITLSDGSIQTVDKQTPVEIFDAPTQVTYSMPDGSTISATEAAAAFTNVPFNGHIAQVIGNNTNKTLTFICENNFYIEPVAIDLKNGNSQNADNWKTIQVSNLPVTSFFNGNSWSAVSALTVAANNAKVLGLPGVNTGVVCGELVE
ncbi:hypothetical protein LO80_07680 [Candidatus Francisella endociliophora]|uniref:Lipoprotein n=1 Tax=Candidatus Francisella endociliophora TaxID=653937 RepID=A0A097EQN7_9GAMM|nr:DUF3281 family protein [Francisella sp. FSC1006]AIT09861.1 hypothetical protein LO80_07680 [Francisella sp. FSC1006]